MPIIEFYGAGGLEMTTQLTKALGRHIMNCYNFDTEWNFIGTNLDKAEKGNSNELTVLSIPVYFQSEESGLENNPFFSFEKIIIDKKDQKYISDFSKIFCDDDSLNTEKIEGAAPIDNRDAKFCKKVNLILDNVAKIPTSHDIMKIRTLNIQSGDRAFWNKELEQVFSPENMNTFYIFYWSMRHEDIQLKTELGIEGNTPEFLKKIKKKYEIHDRIWGFSKFMRDFLKIRNRCFELEYSEIKHFSESEIRNLIDLKIAKIEHLPPFDLMTDNIKNILNDFELKNSKHDFNISDLALLYLYNRNNHFQSNYFDLNFEDFIKSATGSAHHLLHEKDKLLLKPDKSDLLGGLESKLFFYDLFKNITDACINFKDLEPNNQEIPEFIFLDDVVPENLKDSKNQQYWNKYQRLQDWFPGSNFYYSKERNFLDLLFSIRKEGDENTETRACKFDFSDHKFDDYKISSFNEKEKDNPLFIGIDIDWNGEQYGFELLKQFRRNVHLMKRPCFIFVFSRYEYPATIRKAVASGALFYITKQNFLNLVHKVYLILRRINPKEITNPKYRTYESWHLLNKLEPAKIVQLKSEIVKGISPYDPINLDSEQQKHAWKWIKRLPKADLHCHIGSCLGPDLLPITAALVLFEKLRSNKIKKENLGLIVDFVSLIVRDLNIAEDGNSIKLKNQSLIEHLGFKYGNKENEKKYDCVFNLLTNECKLIENLIFPEVVLLDPQNTIIERIFSDRNENTPYFEKRKQLRDVKIVYDDLILFLIIVIFIKDKNIKSEEEFKECILKEHFNKIVPEEHLDKFPDLITHIQTLIENLSTYIKYDELNTYNLGKTNILSKLQSSRGKSNSLFSYLRGCEYGGSAHLQTKASISLACYYIVHHYAIPDNIRYLTLRCAVDGYSKSGFLTNDTAMQALLSGFDNAIKLTRKKIHVDLILTAKRHKSIREFEENVSLALQYRNGLNLPKGFKKDNIDSFFSSKTKVVSFDLAGLEKGNRASKYLPQFMPLLKQCFPITIHAGEEDDHEAIWEAIYLIQSQRIGHGLTLRDNPDLIELVRDRHIAIELCPLSNILTRKKGENFDLLPPEFRNGSEEADEESFPAYNKSKYYPLRQYLMENLDVTINTDNPFISGSTLTEEYLIAASLAGGLTKWELLRLVKNSFRSAAIPKDQKKLLMNEIDDEIYNLLFEE